MADLLRDLFPICRSIAGDGLRRTIRRIGEEIPLAIHEVPTGTPAFDWVVPQEWRLDRATLRGADGRTIADTNDTNLHVLNYSTPFAGTLSRDALDGHLHSMPDKPKWVPYRTSYYKPVWGLCLADRVRSSLPAGEYRVDIRTTIEDGALTYGELFVPGESDDEFLVSAHCCHPSLANDNLSGIAVAVAAAREVLARRPKVGVRFVFAPGTIGAITWLSRNVEATRRIIGGVVLSNLGDPGAFTYKRSRQGDASTDRAAGELVASHREFIPYGYDERQYGSPGFDLPVGCLMRTPHGEFAEYHTSADDLSFIAQERLDESATLLVKLIERVGEIGRVAKRDERVGDGPRFRNLSPCCEPQLGRRGLYAMTGGHAHAPTLQMALLWLLNYGDEQHGLDWIADRAKIDRAILGHAADLLIAAKLLERV